MKERSGLGVISWIWIFDLGNWIVPLAVVRYVNGGEIT